MTRHGRSVDAALDGALRRPLVLASASPRRADLLAQVGVEFEVRASELEEDGPAEGAEPGPVAAGHARGKALSVAGAMPGRLVLGADTVVVLDGSILGKPDGPEEACEMLRRLSGREHRVITAVVFALGGGEDAVLLAEEQVATRVLFRELSDREIEAYVATGEPLDKAGGYGIQGHGALLVRGIRGCYYNVVGLPLVTVWETLMELGYEGRELGD